jgi:hypothetical protein
MSIRDVLFLDGQLEGGALGNARGFGYSSVYYYDGAVLADVFCLKV